MLSPDDLAAASCHESRLGCAVGCAWFLVKERHPDLDSCCLTLSMQATQCGQPNFYVWYVTLNINIKQSWQDPVSNSVLGSAGANCYS